MTRPPPDKQRIRDRLEELRPELVALAEYIHANPETGFAEHKAVQAVADFAARHGFEVSRNVAGLATALHARAGTGPLSIGFCAEYDALPELGHACGHNLIAAIAAGAAAALLPLADAAGISVHLFGTPAEEVLDGGGKILMFEAGVFDGLHALLMAHPAPLDAAAPAMSAGVAFRFRYSAAPGHAFSNSSEAAKVHDAMLIAETAAALLDRRLGYGATVRGARTLVPGSANVVRECMEAHYAARAPDARSLLDVSEALRACFEAGAVATGATLEVIGGSRPYAEMHQDPELARLYRSNAESLGRTFEDRPPPLAITTDLGNVSLVVPALHPFVRLDSHGSANHDRPFASYCTGPAAEACLMDAALALAWTALDFAVRPGESRHREHERSTA